MAYGGHRRRARLGDRLVQHPYLLPLAILLVGGALRFYNLNWDNGHELHPDERWIYIVLSGASPNPPLSWPSSISQFLDVSPQGGSPLNPHFFAYGSMPFYLMALIAGAMSFVGQHVPLFSTWAQVDTYGTLPALGRGVSATLDLLSVLLVFFLGRRLYGYWTAVLAMALAAFTVLDIQLSHFFAVDTVLLPLCLLALLAAVMMADSTARAPYVWGGIALGAALATKTTALLLVIPLGAAPILAAWTSKPWSVMGGLTGRVQTHYAVVANDLNRNLQWTLVTYVTAALSFAILEPYAILDRTKLLSDIAEQTTYLVTNDPPFVVPFTIQYAHTIPYVFQLQNIVFWSLGLPLGLAACAGVAFGIVRLLRGHLEPGQLVLLLWVVPYFLFVGHFFAKFNRYMLPITPVAELLGAAFLVWLLRAAGGRLRLLGAAATAVVVGVSLLYSIGYESIYAQPNTRVAASRWIYSHIPAGSNIAVEGPWDDPLPLDENGHSGGAMYHFTNLDLYAGETSDTDGQHKIANITDVLTRYQYLIMSSERLIGSIPKLPERYPIAIRYYQLLFSGKLNFRLVHQFQAHPQIGPFVVEDYAADESFHVYDHPNVRIFERVRSISPQEVRRLLTSDLPHPPASADPATLPTVLRPRTPRPDTRLILSAGKWNTDQDGPTLTSMFSPDGVGMNHPILIWLLALEVFGLLAFPFTFFALRGLTDRGFVVAKTLGLLLVSYVVWMAVNLGLATYDQGLIAVVTLIFAVISGLFAYALREQLVPFIRTRWRTLLTGEAVFLAGFGILVLLRMWYPDLGHQFSAVAPDNIGSGRMGEKQMELAFLNAIVRSRVFPPYDPFFAHGYINYYYYGLFLVGTLCKLTAISPVVGFNLAIATFFGMLMGNVFSSVHTLTRRVVPGLLAAFFVGLLGNLNGGWQLVRGLMGVASVHSGLPLVGGILDLVSGVQQVALGQATLPPFDYWESRSIFPFDINEFPYFTYLFADLHPHLMAFPLTAAAIAVGASLACGRDRTAGSWMLLSVLAALLLGAIAATNPWDYPTYLLVVALGALIGLFASRGRLSLRTLVYTGLFTGIVAAISAVLYLPFKASYQTVFSTGIGLVRDVRPETLQQAGICPDQGNNCPDLVHDTLVTPLRLYLEHFGFFLFLLLSYVGVLAAVRLRVGKQLDRWAMWAQVAVYYRDRLPRLLRAVRGAQKIRRKHNARGDMTVVWVTLALVAGLVLFHYFLLAFLVLGLALTGVVAAYLAPQLGPRALFALGLFVLGLLLSAVTQLFFVKDFLAGGAAFRMNTIFKFYNQVWVLFAISASVALYYLVVEWQDARDHAPSADPLAEIQLLAPGPSLDGAGVEVSRPVEVSQPVVVGASIHGGETSRIAAQRGTQLDGTLPYHEEPPDSGNGNASPPPDHGRVWQLAFGPLFSVLRRHPFWTATLLVLTCGSLAYTYAGTVSRETYRTTWLPENSVPFTLDGSAFMKVAYPDEYAAINWLNSHVRGAQVIAEADNTYYDWRSRVSMFTGLPTIINGIHESEQRYPDEIDPSALCDGTRDPAQCQQNTHSRESDLHALYDSPSISEAWRVIRQYHVRYIYVGFSERQCVSQANQCFSRAGLAKFDSMVGHGIRAAYRRGSVTIYQVLSQ